MVLESAARLRLPHHCPGICVDGATRLSVADADTAPSGIAAITRGLEFDRVFLRIVRHPHILGGASAETAAFIFQVSIRLISQSAGIVSITPVPPVEFLYPEVMHA